MIVVISNMLDQGSAHISENSLQVGLIIAASDRVIIEHPLDTPVQENVLHALRRNEVCNEAPGLRGVQIFLAHSDERIQRAVSFGVHPDVNVPAILVGTMMYGGSATGAGKICQEKIAGVRELRPDSLYSIEQSANHFRGGIRPALIAHVVARKLIGKDDAIFQASLIGTSIGDGKRLTCLDKNQGRDYKYGRQDQGTN